MKHDTHSTGEGSARVWLIDAQTIGCKLRGYISEPIAREAMHQTKQLIGTFEREGRKPHLLIDISEVRGQSTGARSAAKELGSFSLSKIALCGGSRTLNAIAQYIVRAGGMSGYTKLFRTETQALAWLHSISRPLSKPGNRLRIILPVVVLVIAVATLAGWIMGSAELTTIVQGLEPMNPFSAITLILLATALLFLRKGSMPKWCTIVVGTLAATVIFVGVAVLLDRFFHLGLPSDDLFFKNNLGQSALSGRMPPLSAAGFILCGGMILMALTGQQRRWQQYCFQVSSMVLFLLAVASIIKLGFGLGTEHDMEFLQPISLRTAVCFLLLNHALQTAKNPLPIFERGRRLLDPYWSAITVCFAILLLTSATWRQTRSDVSERVNASVAKQLNEAQDSIVDRTAAYINALRGYKAFFESSDKVTVDEFHSYFINSQLAENYPGFSTINFVSNVPARDKQSFVAQLRKEAGATHARYKTYAITPATTNDPSYPVTYSEPATTGSGFDLSTDPQRLQTLQEARDSGTPVATGTINLNISMGPAAPFRPGFFITIPVYRPDKNGNKADTVEQRRIRHLGFINAVFEDKELFSDVFQRAASNNDIRIVISNATTRDVMYVHNPKVALAITEPRQQRKLSVAGEQWNVALFTPSNFGREGTAGSVQWVVLAAGLTLAVLATWLIMSLSRRREQAVGLANSMTEDLHNERDVAVATQRKDEAILTSIGDGVFAIDANGTITLFNHVAEKISGYTAAEVLDKPYKKALQFVFEKDGKVNDGFITQALAGHVTSMKNHTVLIRKDGQRVPVADSAAPIRDIHGTLLGVIVVFRDISKEYALDQAKTEFVSLASHQLRTPLTAISWNTELLMDGEAGKLSKDQKVRMAEIQAGTKRMIDLVNALLDASRLDLGKLANDDASRTSLGAMVNDLAEELRKGAHTPKVVTQFDEHIPSVLASPKLVRIVVQNLLSNAMKYTPEKGVVTATLRTATPADKHAARLHTSEACIFFSVADTGYGIPKAQQEKIFSKLFRADNVRVLDVEGTGLGLYIVDQVVTKLGGKIWFESIESVGTTFYVVLPVKTRAGKKKTGQDQP